MRDGRFHKYWVYMMSTRTATLYTGITGFLGSRSHQHKESLAEGFTK